MCGTLAGVGCPNHQSARRNPGYKLVLVVGNPLAVTVHGFDLKVRYGPRDDNVMPREATVRFTDRLRPGAWNRVTMVLSPCKAEDTAFLAASMSVDNLSLYGRTR